MEAPDLVRSAHEELAVFQNLNNNSPCGGALQKSSRSDLSVTPPSVDTYISVARRDPQDFHLDQPDYDDPILGGTPAPEDYPLHRSTSSGRWHPGGAAHTPLASMPGSFITPNLHGSADTYMPGRPPVSAALATHTHANMYALDILQMSSALISNDRTGVHDPMAAVHASYSTPLIDSTRRVPPSSRRLMLAFEVLTGKSATDPTVCTFTSEHLVQTVLEGNAYLSHKGITNATQVANVNSFVYNVDHIQATYPVQLDEEWTIHVKIPREPAARSFVRRKGGGAWFHPEGLLYMAMADVGLHLRHYDVTGPYSPIHSQAAPGHADIRLLGTLKLTANELVINKARDIDETQGILKTTVENQFSKNAPLNLRAATEEFSCNDWLPTNGLELIDYHVRHLATGISRTEFPGGKDRGPITAAIEYVLDHPEHSMLKLSGIEGFVAHFGLDTDTTFARSASGLNLDRDAIVRLEPTLKAYRKLCAQKQKTLSS